MVQEKAIRLVLVQDYCLLRGALAERLGREPLIEVCGHTGYGDGVEKLVAENKPDIVLMSISLKTPAGFTLLKHLKQKIGGVPVLTFSCDLEFEHLHAEMALYAGADGFVSAADDENALIQAIHTVKAGSAYISRQLNRLRDEKEDDKFLYADLSRREIEVFCLTGCGYVPKAIAEKLNLSVKTVESYRERIRGKLGYGSGAELLYASTSYMRHSADRRSERIKDHRLNDLLPSARLCPEHL